MSPEGDVALVADEDHGAIQLVALPVREDSKSVRFETPGRPAQIVALGRTVLATIREMPDASGALVTYSRGADAGSTTLTETRRVPLPADAWGLAVSPDGTTAAVTSAWTAKVSIVDVASGRILATRDVAREPRGVAFTADGDTVYVTHLIGAELTKIAAVHGDATVTRVALPASPVRSPSAEKLSASLGYSLVMAPDRTRLFAPRHALGALGSNAWFGASTVDVLDVPSDAPRGTVRQVNAHGAFAPIMSIGGQEIPKYSSAAATAIAEGDAAFSVPRAAVYRRSQRSLLVASEGGNTLVELDAGMSDPTLGQMHVYELETDREPVLRTAIHGGAPSGVALSADESTAFVYCRSTDELAAVPLATWEGMFDAAAPRFVKLAEDAPDAEYVAGRRLFYAGSNHEMSQGMACAGCHPEGRDDGHVWHEVEFRGKDGEVEFTNLLATASLARHLDSFWKDTQFARSVTAANVDKVGAGYARRTPMLAGRVRALGPYGWHGEAKTLDDRVMRGFELHRWSSTGERDAVRKASAYRLGVFLRKGLVPPPAERRAPTSEEQRGREIFMGSTAACATCHKPETDWTTREVLPMPQPPLQPGFFLDPSESFKVPSLVSLAGHAPFFHDGRFATLEALVAQNGDRMGKTSQLNEADRAALVAFLKTL